jgi:hypothetical protein
MPPLSTRIGPRTRNWSSPPTAPATAPFDGGDNQLSTPGNIAPLRGSIPPEFTYDFQTNRFNPDTPFFQRGAVDVITPVRNLALQAAAAAGVKIT